MKNFQKVHFIGIGGIGMSGLARIFLNRGIKVSGSDDEKSSLIEELIQEGVVFYEKGHELNFCRDCDLVVYSAAIPADNPQRVGTEKLGIPLKTYAETLGLLSQEYQTIAVCGTHGKSTVTAMLGLMMTECALDPSLLVGTLVREFGDRNVRLGSSNYFVVEACEYQRSFLSLSPQIIILNNIEIDHLDYFKDEDDYIRAFEEFVKKLPVNGLLIANFDSEIVQKVAECAPCKVISFGEKNEQSDFRLEGKNLIVRGVATTEISLAVPGHHNLLNTLGVFALADYLRLDLRKVAEILKKFRGTWRRFDFRGSLNGADIYDDYAHHPREIEATLQAAREKYGFERKIIVCFQPHQYSRTRHMLKEFGQSFGAADQVIIPNIYKVRDTKEDIQSVTPEQLVAEIRQYHKNAFFGDGLEKTAEYLKSNLAVGDVCLVMGAGDVWKISEALMKE